MWDGCGPGSLGSVLAITHSRWLEKVPNSEKAQSTARFVKWSKDMQLKGFFNDFTCAPPTTEEFDLYMKVIVGSVDRCSSAVQEAGRMQRGKAVKALEQAELLLQNCKCFLGEIKYSIQTVHDSTPKQMQVKSLNSLDDMHTQLVHAEDNINLLAPEKKTPSASPPYAEEHSQLETGARSGIFHQLP